MSCHATKTAPRVRGLTRRSPAPGRDLRRGSLFLAGILLAAACGLGGSDATAPSADTADMSATFLENTWITMGRASASYRDQVLSLSGNDGWYTLQIVLENVDGPGRYSIFASGANSSYATIIGGGKTWSTIWTGNPGSVVVDSLTATRASGTFFFSVATASDPHNDGFRVQNGMFHVRF